MIERLEIRKVGKWEVIMTNTHGFWFPLVIDNRAVKFLTLDAATKWLLAGNRDNDDI